MEERDEQQEAEPKAEPQVGPPAAFGVRRAGEPDDLSYYAYGPDAASTAILMGTLYMRSGEPLIMVDATETTVAQIGKLPA